jgi:hypothetical protein
MYNKGKRYQQKKRTPHVWDPYLRSFCLLLLVRQNIVGQPPVTQGENRSPVGEENRDNGEPWNWETDLQLLNY